MSGHRNYGAKTRVDQYGKDRPGLVLTTGDVAAGLDIPSSTVSAALAALCEEPRSGWRKEQRGAYVYGARRSAAKPDVDIKPIDVGTYAECTGYTASGEPIFRDENNVQYVAKVIK